MTERRWVVFEDESGAALNGLVRRTWGQHGVTPVVRLNGSRGARENMAAFVAYRPGFAPRLLVWHKSREGYTKEHFPLLLTMLHARLGGPVTLIWDNYSSHTSAQVREWAKGQERWLRIVPLPAYAPELNPVELLWKIVKDLLANRAFRSIHELAEAADAALSKIKHSPHLLHGFFTGTGLALLEGPGPRWSGASPSLLTCRASPRTPPGTCV
ncbi:IS630 family transposase [Streptacidiphilus albus]|uniref:IS630 family transposase n=1 Tax=Streptacidiphilus albus TaxID=105425 RepID=UPI0006915C44|nr:IS630 family transposase [Streptacidiphilus albus]